MIKNKDYVPVAKVEEGMFNNANCIFRTKFVDGMSTVRRSTPLDKKQQQEQDNFARDISGNGKKLGRAKGNKSRKALSSRN